jgi:hypothetical protein
LFCKVHQIHLWEHFYLGGTTDIVVQEKLKDGKLKYLCKSSGEKCGGTNVDEELRCTKSGKRVVMYLCVRGMDFASFYDFDI